MKVSFIVPYHRPGPLLNDCIRSIKSQISSHATEIVLVDNCARPSPYPETPGLRCVRCEVRGPAAARNAGAKAAHGEFYAFVDSDVRLFPGWLEHALGELERHPLIGGVQGPIVSAPLNPRSPRLIDRYRWARKRAQTRGRFTCTGDRALLNTAACLVRGNAYRRAGGFEERLLRAEDAHFTMRLLAEGFFLSTTMAARADVRFSGGWGEFFGKHWHQGAAQRQIGAPLRMSFSGSLWGPFDLMVLVCQWWGSRRHAPLLPPVVAKASPSVRLMALDPFTRLVWTGEHLCFMQLRTGETHQVPLSGFKWKLPIDMDGATLEALAQRQITA